MQDFQESPQPADAFEVEFGALDSAAQDDAEGSMQVPPGQRLSRTARARRLLPGASALVALLLVAALVPALRNQALSLFGGSVSHAPTPGSFRSAPLTPLPTPGPGWTLAGPRDAATLAFAAGVPGTGYTCGLQQPAGNQPGPLLFGVTHDAGRSWQTLRTPATAVFCDLTIDLTDAEDVVLLASPCEPCSASQAAKLYRTFDGGAHWSLWSLPPLGATPLPVLWYTQWVWVGSTLFMAPYLAGDTGYVRLAASVAGQAFAWLNTQGLFARAPADTAINELFATTTTLYLELFSPSCTSGCPGFLQSRDGGASWSPFHALFQGQPAALLAMGEDGRTLLGQISEGSTPTSRVYVRSGDGGDTWRALPRLPEGLLASTMTATPDGTVYAAFDQIFATAPQAAELGIYKVVPGASAWRYAASLPPGSWFVAASDAAGHPVALWGRADTSALPSGMERHQP